MNCILDIQYADIQICVFLEQFISPDFVKSNVYLKFFINLTKYRY